jgi:hypothetical protein
MHVGGYRPQFRPHRGAIWPVLNRHSAEGGGRIGKLGNVAVGPAVESYSKPPAKSRVTLRCKSSGGYAGMARG